MKGKFSQIKYSDYQEVAGAFVAFSQSIGIKDGESQTLSFEKIEANPTVGDAAFKMPTE
jgi:hypothetical protein